VSSWYRGLQRLGTVNGVEPPFFYVSTGSWSFYEMLTQFLQLRGFPRGPLFLTDWGPTDRYLHRSGAMHKRHTIGRIMLAYPDTPFVFVGDTGQGDADAYIDAARRFGRQVKLVVLLPAGDEERLAHVQGLAEAARAEGLPVHVVAGAQEAAELSLQLGLVDALALEEVRTELGAVF
jgi:phosphatidate phosphatase APP1